MTNCTNEPNKRFFLCEIYCWSLYVWRATRGYEICYSIHIASILRIYRICERETLPVWFLFLWDLHINRRKSNRRSSFPFCFYFYLILFLTVRAAYAWVFMAPKGEARILLIYYMASQHLNNKMKTDQSAAYISFPFHTSANWIETVEPYKNTNS